MIDLIDMIGKIEIIAATEMIEITDMIGNIRII